MGRSVGIVRKSLENRMRSGFSYGVFFRPTPGSNMIYTIDGNERHGSFRFFWEPLSFIIWANQHPNELIYRSRSTLQNLAGCWPAASLRQSIDVQAQAYISERGTLSLSFVFGASIPSKSCRAKRAGCWVFAPSLQVWVLSRPIPRFPSNYFPAVVGRGHYLLNVLLYGLLLHYCRFSLGFEPSAASINGR